MGLRQLKKYRPQAELRVLKKEAEQTIFKPWFIVLLITGLIGAGIIYNAKKQDKPETLEQYVEKVLNEKQAKKRFVISKIPQKLVKEIGAFTTKTVKGFNYIIMPKAIEHISKKHGYGNEYHKKQEGIGINDYKYLKHALTKPDSLSRGYNTRKGERTVKFFKFAGDNAYIVIAVVSTKKKNISVITYFIKTKPQ